jgi:hypothetical protein
MKDIAHLTSQQMVLCSPPPSTLNKGLAFYLKMHYGINSDSYLYCIILFLWHNIQSYTMRPVYNTENPTIRPGIFFLIGAGEGNRTLAASLGSWSSTIEPHPQD